MQRITRHDKLWSLGFLGLGIYLNLYIIGSAFATPFLG